MKALAWHGKGDIRCEEVPDPAIEHPRARLRHLGSIKGDYYQRQNSSN